MYEHMQGGYEAEHINKQYEKHLQRKACRNLERALALEEAMFNWCSRHLILILTLNYKDEYRSIIALDDIQRHRDTFLNNFRTNKLLQPINAYIWKIEEGDGGGGLHMHVVLFYDRAHHADIKIAKDIGEYWESMVTSGIGFYRNSNADKDKYRYIATGQIDRRDLVKRNALRDVLKYMAKCDQRVMSRVNPHCRMFGTSQIPV